MSTTTISYHKPSASGRREGWAKVFDEINGGVRGAAAFVGEYLHEGENELPEGALVLCLHWAGSVKNGVQIARIRRAVGGGLQSTSDEEFEWRGQFVSLRKEAERLLAQGLAPAGPPTAEELARLITDEGWGYEVEDWTEYLTSRARLQSWPDFGPAEAEALAAALVALVALPE